MEQMETTKVEETVKVPETETAAEKKETAGKKSADKKAAAKTEEKAVVEEKAAKAEAATEKKAAEKKTAAKKTAEKKTAEKKTVKEPAEKKTTKAAAALNPEVYIQFQNQQAETAQIIEKIKKQYVSEGHRASSIKKLQVYVKPEEFAVYYVINQGTKQESAGRVDLF